MRIQPAKDGGSAGPCPKFLGDLEAVLAEGHAVYLRLGPEGAVLSVKAPEAFAFGQSIGTKWFRMTPEARARLVVRWLREAATYCRNPKVRWAPPA